MGVRLERLDRWGGKIGELSGAIEAVHELSVDGTDGLSITCLDDLQKGEHVRWRDPDTGQTHEHEVVSTRRTHDTSGRPVTRAECANHVCELFGDDLAAVTLTGLTAAGAMRRILSATRWHYLDGDDFPEVRDWEFGDTSVREAVAQVVEELGCEMVAYPTRGITLLREIASTTVTGRLSYGRAISSVTREVAPDEVYTAVRATGADGIEETVFDTRALDSWGRPDGAGGKAHRYCRMEAPECATIEELRERATARLAEVSQPRVTYTCDVADVGARRLGDLVQVVDRAFSPALSCEARITHITKDLLGRGRGGRVTVGSRRQRYMEVAFASIAGATFRRYVGQ